MRMAGNESWMSTMRMTKVSNLPPTYAAVRPIASPMINAHTVLITYAFRNALLPIANVLGMVFSFLLGSNVLVEQVFGWQGIGAYAVSAVLASDYAAVQGFVLMMALLYILLNLLVDVASTFIDPRVRFEG